MRRSAVPSGSGVSGRAACDPGFESAYPLLFEHLAAVTWEDGSARETSTLMVLCELGRVKLGLNDRSEGRSLWVTGDTLEAALAVLEGSLRTGSADWRAKPQTPSRRR